MVDRALGGGAPDYSVRAFWRLAALASCLSCGAARVPDSLRGYEIVVDRTDPQASELARAFKDHGLKVRRAVKGGSRPTAAAVFFVFRAPGEGEPAWFHLRLADTRSGVIVAAASIVLDSTAPNLRARAQAAVDAILAKPLPTPP